MSSTDANAARSTDIDDPLIPLKLKFNVFNVSALSWFRLATGLGIAEDESTFDMVPPPCTAASLAWLSAPPGFLDAVFGGRID